MMTVRQGSAWELVLPTPALAPEFTKPDPALARRDLALQALPAREPTALERPTGPVPTLSGDRHLHLPRTSGRFIYFESERPRRTRGSPHPRHHR